MAFITDSEESANGHCRPVQSQEFRISRHCSLEYPSCGQNPSGIANVAFWHPLLGIQSAQALTDGLEFRAAHRLT